MATLDKNAPLGHTHALQGVAETNKYSSQIAKLLSDSEKDKVTIFVARNPLKGDLIEGTGGVRKLRFAKGSSGKSGGVRVVYYFHDTDVPILLMEMISRI